MRSAGSAARVEGGRVGGGARPSGSSGTRSAALLVLLAGAALTAAPGWMDQARAQGMNPLLQERPQAVVVSRVFVDEAVSAREAVSRARELAQGGNPGEAARVLQRVLDADAEQVLDERVLSDGPAPEGDAGGRVYRSVRHIVHELLRSDPALLERYRAEQEAPARALLASGDLKELTRGRLLTSAGLEGALRQAQVDMEAARFHAARFLLEELAEHPDVVRGEASQASAKAVGDAAKRLSAYVRTPSLLALVEAMRERAGGGDGAEGLPPLIAPPARARVLGLTSLAPQPGASWEGVEARALQRAPFREEEASGLGAVGRGARVSAVAPRTPWVMPAVSGETVVVSDGSSIRAHDAGTLATLWEVRPGLLSTARPLPMAFAQQVTRFPEDLAGPAVRGDLVVAALGRASNSGRLGDSRVHAVRLRDGQPLWSVEPAWLDERLEGGSVRGVPLIEADTVVIAVRKQGPMRRVVTLYLVGLDAITGGMRWVRPVGSMGTQPWSPGQVRVDQGVLHEGVVYRGDEIGVLGAYEATTGRPRWVLLTRPQPDIDPMQGVPMNAGEPPSEAVAPVVIGNHVYFVEPGVGSVVQVDARSGAILARREAKSVGEVQYLVGVGSTLALVGRASVGLLDADNFAGGKVVRVGAGQGGERAGERSGERSSDQRGSERGDPRGPGARGAGEVFAGRVTALGDVLAAPVSRGLLLIDPRNPAGATLRELEASGNPIVAQSAVTGGADGAPAGAGFVLIASDSALHTFLSWDRARAGLEARIAARPREAAPILTMLELALRVGRAELAPGLVDRVLTLVAGKPDAPDMIAARERAFALLIGTLEASRRSAAAPSSSSNGDGVVRDLALLAELEDRASRCAETPEQRVRALLERAFVRDARGEASVAVDALQEVLLDPALGAVTLQASAWSMPAPPAAQAGAGGDVPNAGGTQGGVPEVPAGPLTAQGEAGGLAARDVARERLLELLTRAGEGAYEVYDREAEERRATMQNADAPALLDLAQRYPLSRQAVRAGLDAGALLAARRDSDAARDAFAQAARAALGGLQMGRTGADESAGEALSALLPMSEGAGRSQPLQRLLLWVGERYPSVRLTTASGTRTPAEAAQDLALRDRRVHPMPPRTFRERAGVLRGWEALEPIETHKPGLSLDSVVVASRDGTRLAQLSLSPLTGELEPAWERGVESLPSVLRMTPRATLLFWPRAQDAGVEAVDAFSGRTLWRTQALAQVPGLAALPAPVGPQVGAGGGTAARTSTPLDGSVRADDVVYAGDDEVILLAERRGRAGAFSARDGSTLWGIKLPVDEVFDAESSGDLFVVVGARVTRREAGAGGVGGGEVRVPVVAGINKATGEIDWELEQKDIGNHARFARALGDAGEGTTLVGTSDGLVLVGQRGQVVWKRTQQPVRGGVGAWRVGGSLFVMDGDFALWRMSFADAGEAPAPVDTRQRVLLPFRVHALQDRLVITSNMGLVSVREDGRVAGVDALQQAGRLEPAQAGEGAFLIVESGERDVLGAGDVTIPARAVLLDPATARVMGEQRFTLYDTPTSVTMLDGVLLVGQGPMLMVYRGE